jgi:hypothetical protein
LLLLDDAAYLRRQEYEWVELPEGGLLSVVIRKFRLPVGYQVDSADLLVRLPPGFPDAPPDMWWFDPPLKLRSTGTMPLATEAVEAYVGRTWQRWSRHLPPGYWRPGRSGLESYLTLVRKDLEKWTAVVAQ